MPALPRRSFRSHARACLLDLAVRTAWVVALINAVPHVALSQDTTSQEGCDLVVGGPGSAPGQFLELRDITFDSLGNLFVLEGVRLNPTTRQQEGNLRVQKFTRAGAILGAIDLRSVGTPGAPAPQGETIGPQRIAADKLGNVYVTVPESGKVLQLNADGRMLRSYDVPHAMAITLLKGNGGAGPERIAVVASRHEVVPGKGWTWLGGERIVIFSTAGGVKPEKSVALGHALENVEDLATDAAGNFYVKADPNAIYKFSPEGKLLKTFGGNPTTRAEDGSEVLHSVAVDSKGNVYTMSWGNPGLITRFDADGKTVTQRGGQFKWADPWSEHSSYVPLAIDPDDRLWAASTIQRAPDHVHYKLQRAVPAIVRTSVDFFENPTASVKVTPVHTLGFKAELRCGLPYNISYTSGKPVPMALAIAPAQRGVNSVTVTWHTYDAVKNEVDRGRFDIKLVDGKPVNHPFAFTPPRFGSYMVLAEITSEHGPMGNLAEHVGVTFPYPNMKKLSPGESLGGWNDAPRQLFAGLPNMRIHPGKDEAELKKTDEQIAAAEKAGLTYLLQVVDNMKNLTPAYVRLVAARYKGRVKYYEICNEPNFSSTVDEYFAGHQMAYKIIKEVDPKASVMGPATVNMNLVWLSRLYELGFKDVTDIVSTHDYEGHESITPEHWVWKFAQMRSIMATHDDAAKPIWQTERAISGVRGIAFQGLVQAIRCTMHRDLLESLGVPAEHNFLFYLNEGGYSSVPSYLWSGNGPHPAALALRTRHALTRADGRSYAGTLDFGPTGNTLLFGVRYAGKSGETVALRNRGSRPIDVEFGVATAGDIIVTDAWGNNEKIKPDADKFHLNIPQLPIYVQLAPGQHLTPPLIHFGTNIAAQAKWEYSAAVEKGTMALLTNGIYETYHDADPNGDTDGSKVWTGALPTAQNGESLPQTLTGMFDHLQSIDHVIVRGVRGDNGFCALMDYDLEYFDGNTWKVFEQIRSPMPPSKSAQTKDATTVIWMDDTNFFVHSFSPVQASGVRLRALKVSHGFMPDDVAKTGSNVIPFKLMLREIEVFGNATAK